MCVENLQIYLCTSAVCSYQCARTWPVFSHTISSSFVVERAESSKCRPLWYSYGHNMAFTGSGFSSKTQIGTYLWLLIFRTHFFLKKRTESERSSYLTQFQNHIWVRLELLHGFETQGCSFHVFQEKGYDRVMVWQPIILSSPVIFFSVCFGDVTLLFLAV